MKFEKPQKGNPHNLTIKQHSFPKKSIERFANNGVIQVFLINENRTFFAKSDNEIFCVRRVWDQRTEQGYMKRIEDEFQELADELSQKSRGLSDIENSLISDFYLLWCLKLHYSDNPVSNQRTPGIPGSNLNKDQEEILESRYTSFIKSNGLIPGRFINSGHIQVHMNNLKEKQFKNVKWNILEAKKGEFIVPDNFSPYKVVPINPMKCFSTNGMDRFIEEEEVAIINKTALSTCRKFYFARDITSCPVF